MRTISEPARCSAATCATVWSTSAVSVLVIDCTTTGAPPPTITPPTSTPTDVRRGKGEEKYPVMAGRLLISGATCVHVDAKPRSNTSDQPIVLAENQVRSWSGRFKLRDEVEEQRWLVNGDRSPLVCQIGLRARSAKPSIRNSRDKDTRPNTGLGIRHRVPKTSHPAACLPPAVMDTRQSGAAISDVRFSVSSVSPSVFQSRP